TSNTLEKGKNPNQLTDEPIQKNKNTYQNRATIDKYNYEATLQEIEGNDYNLNIPRYVDTFEKEAPIDLDQVQQNIANIENDIAQIKQDIEGYLKKLGVLQ
ncbi:N-6 DNA methylase, partial [Staphylococcus pseudintermedius]|uniref:N-6 DNA methylase n=1 Tax=Staphylococcus pseudintermedius TaxID=283734 RepID=UPI000E3878E0